MSADRPYPDATQASRERFEAHAAPEAIEAELERAKRELVAAASRRDWLDRLLARRRNQIRRGEWPAKPDPVAPAERERQLLASAADLIRRGPSPLDTPEHCAWAGQAMTWLDRYEGLLP